MKLHRSIAQLQRWGLSASLVVLLGGYALQGPTAIAAEPSDNSTVIAQSNDHQWDQVRGNETIASAEDQERHETVASAALDSEPVVVVHNRRLLPAAQRTASSYHGSCHNGASPYPDSMFGYGQNFNRCP